MGVALRRTENEFEALINSIPQLAWMTDPDGHAYWYNDRFYDYTGTTFDDLKDEGWTKLHDPKRLPEVLRSWAQAVAAGVGWEGVIQLKGRNGKYRWFMSRTIPVRDDTGTITGWIGTGTDIDEQTSFQRQLVETLDAMTDTFLAIDKDWKISQVNSVLLRETGLKREELIGRDFRDVFLSTPETQKSKYWTEYHRLMKDRVSVSFEEYYEPYNMWTATRAYPTSEGGFTIFSVDVTERKRAEQAMRIAKEEAERASKLKSSFLANMSHEIRTPLGAMLGFADLLRDPNLSSEERSSYLDILVRNGEQLSFIINDILDLSKVEAGHLTLQYSKTFPDAIASDVVALMRMKSKEKDLLLQYSGQLGSPNHVVSDPLRVRQVLLNLVNNAVKFTESGSVKISGSTFFTPKGRRCVSFEITDTGIGIDEAQYERIFGTFVQADDSMTKRFGGTGLGLALSRRLARSLGGDVTVKTSSVNHGSTFVFTFEDRPEMMTRAASMDSPDKKLPIVTGDHPLEGLRVLLVDDSPDNQKLISRFLTKAGAEIETAENGLEGSAKALADGFDLVLMDLQMPVMDGYTATQSLRDQGYKQPIIALTAHALSEVREKALEIGCTDHLSKPINPKLLVATVAKYSRGPHHLH